MLARLNTQFNPFLTLLLLCFQLWKGDLFFKRCDPTNYVNADYCSYCSPMLTPPVGLSKLSLDSHCLEKGFSERFI